MFYSKLFTGSQNSNNSNPSIKFKSKNINTSSTPLKQQRKAINAKKLFTSIESIALKTSNLSL